LNWLFRIRTSADARLPSRILQIIDTQRIQVRDLRYRTLTGAAELSFLLECDEAKATRIGALILRLHPVHAAVWSLAEHYQDLSSSCAALRHPNGGCGDLEANSPFWSVAPSVFLTHNAQAGPEPAHITDIRLRWDTEYLSLLFICPYAELHLRPAPTNLLRPTPALWEYDVAEIFIGDQSTYLQQYSEFEISPRGEWLDLAITPTPGGILPGRTLHSGVLNDARIDEENTTWYGLMRIPFAAISSRAPRPGDTFRVNFFRSQGKVPVELAWLPTFDRSFHKPSHFGYLTLV